MADDERISLISVGAYEMNGTGKVDWVGRIVAAVRLACFGSSVLTMFSLAACGGGASGVDSEVMARQATSQADESLAVQALAVTGSTPLAARFLTQATFGPTANEAAAVATEGFPAWIARQMAMPAFSHTAYWDAVDAQYKAATPPTTAGGTDVVNGVWAAALSANDQLRQRVAFALSEIFVVSLVDNSFDLYPSARMVASFMDTLSVNAFGNYRTLIEAVAMHPAMGIYLSHLRNQKEDAVTGRVPDENFAREVMQLFSIGLYQLNADGSLKLGADGKTIETYGAADVAGLAKVFTGFSWNCGTSLSATCFLMGGPRTPMDIPRSSSPMVGYSDFHSVSAKSFLTASIAAGSSDAKADLKVALDTLFNHSNVGPFIGKQLIQRLVTSNPSPAYVGRVAAVFNNNGSGVRGDMGAVIRAVLLDSEARSTGGMDSNTFGKIREPVLRVTAFLRAFGAKSSSGRYRAGVTDDSSGALAQSPLRAPSVFNFFRPGYAPPNTEAAAAGMVVPEMQIAHEASLPAYVNYMINAMTYGVGNVPGGGTSRDIVVDWTPALAVAATPSSLATLMSDRLLYGQMSTALRNNIISAITPIAIPTATSNNTAMVAAAKLRRAQIAALLTVAAPEFLVQR